MSFLESQRLIMRPFSLRDLNDFHQYAKNPNVGPNAGWSSHKTKWESLKVLNRFISEENLWAITTRDTGVFLGSIGLHYDAKRTNHKVRMLGYSLAEEHWGHGYATEAARVILRHGFEQARLDMISAYHFSSNTASQHVIEKCGFTRDGVIRMAGVTPRGVMTDHVCYSMSRAEFDALYPKQ